MKDLSREECFEIVAVADRDDVIRVGKAIEENNDVAIIRLENVLLPIRAVDGAEGVEFCLGDVLATECKVTVDGCEGYMLVLGDDKDKAYYGAIIDGYFGVSDEKQWLMDELRRMQEKWSRKMVEEMARVYETKVEFETID